MEDPNTVVASYDGINIEELIGFVEEEYPCVYCQVNGTLFAGTDGLAFLGKFYLFNKKIHFKWVDVKVNLTDQGGISIQTRDDEQVLHEFTGIHKPDRVWSALMKLHNEAILDRTKSPMAGTLTAPLPADGGETGATDDGGDYDSAAPSSSQSLREPSTAAAQPIHRRKQLRRMTSDPNKLAPAIDELFSNENKEELLAGDTSSTKTGQAGDADSGSTLPVPPPPPDSSTSKRRSSVIINKEHQLSTRAAESLGGSPKGIDPMAGIQAIVGKIQGQFSCLYNRQTGTLYAGSTAIYFAGDRLFFPARLTVQSSHIRQVKMVKGKLKSDLRKSLSGNNSAAPTVEDAIREQGIEICTHEGISHDFLGMENPDQVWASLVALRNHAGKGPNSSRPFSMRRMNSDPNLTSNTTEYDMMSPANKDKETSGATHDALTKELEVPVLSDEELKDAWSDVMANKNRYKTCVAKNHELGCSLDTFFKSYIDNDAECCLAKYMEAQGDTEISSSLWKPTNKDGKLVRSRVVRYIHPINAPMAPPQAKARKEQTYHRYGDLGIVVETKTFVDDVPMTDCFFVKDKLVIAPGKEAGQVLLTMEFELEFVKSTMFRGLITKTTTSEMSKFFQNMKEYMSKSVGEKAPTSAIANQEAAEVSEKKAVKEEPAYSLPFGLRPASLTHLLLGGVVLMQFWILLEMRSMKSSIYKLEAMELRPIIFPKTE